MPRSSAAAVPKYRHYRPKNLAVVRLSGKDVYLGPCNSPKSWEKYHRLIAEWLADPCRVSLLPDTGHMPWLEDPAAVAACVRRACAGLAPLETPTEGR